MRTIEQIKEYRREYAKRWRAKNILRVRAAQKRDHAKHRQARLESARQYRQRHSEKVSARIRKCRLAKYFGITPADYDNMFDAQQGVCAICKSKPNDITSQGKDGKRLCVDHDHTTGRVRALLCNRCNARLGFIEDPGWFPMALEYLRAHRPQGDTQFVLFG